MNAYRYDIKMGQITNALNQASRANERMPHPAWSRRIADLEREKAELVAEQSRETEPFGEKPAKFDFEAFKAECDEAARFLASEISPRVVAAATGDTCRRLHADLVAQRDAERAKVMP